MDYPPGVNDYRVAVKEWFNYKFITNRGIEFREDDMPSFLEPKLDIQILKIQMNSLDFSIKTKLVESTSKLENHPSDNNIKINQK